MEVKRREIPWLTVVGIMRGALYLSIITFIVLVTVMLYRAEAERTAGDDAVVLVREGTAVAQWSYQQLPMKECRWCGRTVNLNRHHAVPQAANPALRDVKENLIVLCRDCHFVLGHRCNWKRYNPDVLYIATHFTNCVRSADTRREVESAKDPHDDGRGGYAGGGWYTGPAAPTNAIDCTDILHVTNDVPTTQRDALKRILESTGVTLQASYDGLESWHEVKPAQLCEELCGALVRHIEAATNQPGYIRSVDIYGDRHFSSTVYRSTDNGTEGKHTD